MNFEIEFRPVGYKICAKFNIKPQKKIWKKDFFHQENSKTKNLRRPVKQSPDRLSDRLTGQIAHHIKILTSGVKDLCKIMNEYIKK